MTAHTENLALSAMLQRRGIDLNLDDVNTLRRAQLTLRRWAELECGNGNDYASWAIERDENTDIPYFVTYPHDGKSYRRRIADREKGAFRRVQEVCTRNGLHFYHQSDPRGCALYVDRGPLPDNNYTRGISICI